MHLRLQRPLRTRMDRRSARADLYEQRCRSRLPTTSSRISWNSWTAAWHRPRRRFRAAFRMAPHDGVPRRKPALHSPSFRQAMHHALLPRRWIGELVLPPRTDRIDAFVSSEILTHVAKRPPSIRQVRFPCASPRQEIPYLMAHQLSSYFVVAS